MNTLDASLADEISRDFLRACNELNEARGRQNGKDSGANRDAVVECRARIDTVLDMYLESLPSRAGRGGPDRRTGADDRRHTEVTSG